MAIFDKSAEELEALKSEHGRLLAAYRKQKPRIESLEADNASLKAQLVSANAQNLSLKADLMRAIESAKKAVQKARAQQKNSKERAGRLADKLRKLGGSSSE